MSLIDKNDFREFKSKLAPLSKEVRMKALTLAPSIISVYGFSKEVALEEAIKRASEFYEKKDLEIQGSILRKKLIR